MATEFLSLKNFFNNLFIKHVQFPNILLVDLLKKCALASL